MRSECKNSATRDQLIEEVASLRSQVDQLEARQNRHTATADDMVSAFKDAPVGLCYFDAELRYAQVNDFLAAINGLAPEKHIGKPVADVLPGIAAVNVEKELRGVLESGDPIIRGSVTAETAAHPGEEHTYMHDYHAIRSDDGKIVGVSCCITDISELRLAERNRDEHVRSLEQFNKLAVGRELRMIELKREINELCDRFGIEPKYVVEDTKAAPKQAE